ncbi:MAG: ribonuclease Z [Myxococcales bacterium]|nr:ribonuclease Z [Myxococcales bacterium]
MSVRELIVLGTASQVPTRYRNHNGYLLRWDDEGFLFDPGEGTQRQMIYSNVASTAITRICITHFHGDHCLGLAGISQRISLDGAPHPVHVYFPRSGQKYYDRLRRASIYHDVATVVPHPISKAGPIEEQAAWTLTVRPLDHGVDTYGYRLQEHAGRTMIPAKLEEAGVRGPMIRTLIETGFVELGEGDDARRVRLEDVSVPKPGQSVAFVMDTRMCDNAVELARGVDVLVCESTYLNEDEDKARAHGHLTAAQAATIAREAGAKKLILTHFSQRYTSTEPFLAEARPIHSNTIAVRDGDVIPIPRRRKPKK